MESGDPTTAENCAFCGGAVADAVADETAGTTYCSTGCRTLDRDLDAAAADTETVHGDDSAPASVPRSDADEFETTYFRVDGMHSAHCEAYLESVATGRDGVTDAAASYVTETVRVCHDPARVGADALEAALTGLGYTAYRRRRPADPAGSTAERTASEGPGTASAVDEPIGTDATGETHRDREMGGLRKRRSEDVLELRYVLGVVFGSFMLVPYVVLFYPAALADLVDWAPLAIYEGADASLDWSVLPLFLVVTGAILYLTGKPLLRGAYLAVKLRKPNAHLLAAVPIAAAYGYGAIAIVTDRVDLYFDLTILVAALVMGAIYWEATVKRDALSRLTELTRAAVAEARRLAADGATTVVPTDSLDAGDRVLVRQGERIPVDGRLVEGRCTVAEALLTGESLPQERTAGDAVVGGSTVTSGSAVVAVDDHPSSRLDALTRSVWNLQSATHGASDRADELAGRLLAPVALVAAVAGGLALVRGAGPDGALRWVLLAAIVASPWCLAFATPVAVATSLREAAAAGVVVFDETVFDRLRGIDTVVLDKTGTLTTGRMTVRDATGPDDALRAAAALERRASHPAADAVVDAFWPADAATESIDDEPPRADGGVGDPASTIDGDLPAVADFETYPTGVGGTVDGEATLVGHPSLFDANGWTVDDRIAGRVADVREAGHLPVLVGRGGEALGVVTVGDRRRGSWAATVDALAARGIDVVVLTGDDASATGFLTDHDGITGVYAGVSPSGKTEAIERLAARGRVAMVGDGTNDAPALAAADLGISLGGGTALAADAADLAIADDDLGRVERAFALADRARRRRRGTLGLALSYNAIAVTAAVAGVASPLVTTVGIGVAAGLVLAYARWPIGGTTRR